MINFFLLPSPKLIGLFALNLGACLRPHQIPLILEITQQRKGNLYPNTPLKSTCAFIEFVKFEAKIDN